MVVFQLAEYGLVVSGAPIEVHVSWPAGEYWNSADVTVGGLVALAVPVTLTVPVMFWLFVGAVTRTGRGATRHVREGAWSRCRCDPSCPSRSTVTV